MPVYHNVLALMANGEIDIEADTTRVALVTDSYTPNVDHTGWADASANEVANGNGYTTGGVAVAMTGADDDAADGIVVDSADPSWTAASGSIGPFRYAIWYDDTHASNALIAYFDFGSSQTAQDGADITINIDADGLFTIT
jgi:hypothetical protein